MKMIMKIGADELKEIILDYLTKKGYDVKQENIKFNACHTTVGYGMAEHEITCFDGCEISDIEAKEL